jgi:hypothetical protein
MGAHITVLLKKRQSLLAKIRLIAWKASSALKSSAAQYVPGKRYSVLAGVAAGAEHQLFAALIPPSGDV